MCRPRTSSGAPTSSSSPLPAVPARSNCGSGRRKSVRRGSSIGSSSGAPMPRRAINGAALLDTVAARTGYRFGDAARLEAALTHASARRGANTDYQRLEFLGDRVLGLLVAQMLFESFPDAVEGELSLRLNALVNAETLAAVADEIGIGELILAGAEVRKLAPHKRVN